LARTRTRDEEARAAVTTAQRLASLVKACRDTMRKDKGLNGDLDRLPMLTWIMFLKFLDDAERIREDEARMQSKAFRPSIERPYRWRDWNRSNARLPDDGIHNAMTGDTLIAFINQDEAVRPDGERGAGLFAHLRAVQGAAGVADRREVIASVFRGTTNRMQSGYLLRDVLDKVNDIHFSSSDEIHVLGRLYESMLKEMRDAAGDSGEFYTPRPLVQLVVRAVNPVLGDVILDPAAGTGGFLIEAYQHLQPLCRTVEDLDRLQRASIFGIEAKSLPYLLCQMNMLLHGLEAPQVDPLNALRFKVSEIGDSDRVDVVMTNPPFGGEEEKGIQRNFPEDKQTSETALLFLQLIMRKLRRPGTKGKLAGRAGVVVPNGMLFGDGVAARIKQELVETFNLHTVVRLPEGVFAPYTSIPTNVLFFDRSGPTNDIWFYEHRVPADRRAYTKTQPVEFEHFAPLLEWWTERRETDVAWRVSREQVVASGYNLDWKNPTRTSGLDARSPEELLAALRETEYRIAELLDDVEEIFRADSAR
jgi:type I restriction enzyme M protein